VKPKAQYMLNGASALVRYPLDLRHQMQVFEIVMSPGEFTKLLLPRAERLAAKLTLDPNDWEIIYGKSGEEGSRQEIVALRPTKAPQKGREVVLLQSGLTIYLQLIAREHIGMLAVTWDLPESTSAPVPEVPLDRRPPKFNTAEAYAGYTIKLEGKNTFKPPWYPKAVVDDRKNSLIQLGGTMEGQRMPSVVGIGQNGKPALVASRLYIHPGDSTQGAWLYIQGLWPALRLQDAAGLSVLITRQVPASVAEATHAAR
jgi:hypothetical protein